MGADRHGASTDPPALRVTVTPGLFGAAFVAGAVGGVLVLLLPTVVTRAGPPPLLGNGALRVLVAGIPAVLGAGWVGLGLWHLQSRYWLGHALATGTLLFVLGLITAYPWQVFRGSGYDPEGGVARVVAALLIGSSLITRTGGPSRLVLLVGSVVALGIILTTPVAAAGLTPLLLLVAASVPVSTVSVHAGARGWLVGECLAVLGGIVVGMAVGGSAGPLLEQMLWSLIEAGGRTGTALR